MGKKCEFWRTVIQVIGIILSTYIVARGWEAAKTRDLENRKREIITGYLIEAYGNIENACGREGRTTEEQKRKAEQAIADIQLLGSPKQIELAKKFAETMNKESFDDPRYLLVELRNSLREELGLAKASDDPKDIMHWRILGDAPIPAKASDAVSNSGDTKIPGS
jgi:hypothetical protein